MTWLEVWNELDPEFRLYIIVILLMIPVTIIGVIASISVNLTFSKYANVPTGAGVRAPEAVERMLHDNKVTDVSIVRTHGKLTDHYDPRSHHIALSDSVYPSSSVGAVSVALHEAGHAVQHSYGYIFAKIRLALVPVVNFSNRLFMPIIFIGIIFGFMQYTAIGGFIIVLGVVMFGLSMLFSLVTLPTEFDASARALESMRLSGIYTNDELRGAKKVLKAAALTYVVAFLASLLQFLRFLALLLIRLNNKKR